MLHRRDTRISSSHKDVAFAATLAAIEEASFKFRNHKLRVKFNVHKETESETQELKTYLKEIQDHIVVTNGKPRSLEQWREVILKNGD